MKKHILLALALTFSLTVSSQDRLSTVAGNSSGIAVSDEYLKTVDNILGASGSSVRWSYMSRGSFDPEYCVLCTTDDYGARLVANTPKENLWYAGYEGDRNSVEIISSSLRISRDQAWELDALMRLAVESSSLLPDAGEFDIYEDKDGKKRLFESIGMDGTTYVFTHNRRQAQCWSPRPGNCLDMVEFGDLLYNAVRKSDAGLVDQAIQRADSIKEKLFKLVPDWYPTYLEAKTNESKSIRYQDSENTHMHLTRKSGGYELEMGGRSFEGDKQQTLDMIQDYLSNSLMIIDDGEMLWNDAADFAAAVYAKPMGSVTVLSDVSNDKYWKKLGVRNLLTALPVNVKTAGSRIRLSDRTKSLNAAFTLDLEKGGKVIVSPQSDNSLDPYTLTVLEVIAKSDETVLLYTTGTGNCLDMSLKADGKELDLKESEGMEDWNNDTEPYSQRHIPACTKEYTKVMCARFPALPKGTSEFDIIENRNGRTIVRGLSISDRKSQTATPKFGLQGYYYHDNGMVHRISIETDGEESVDTVQITVNGISCYKDKTVLALTMHSFMEPLVLAGPVLELKGVRPLKQLGDPEERMSNRPRNKDYAFEMEFEPMTQAEIDAFEKSYKEHSGRALPDMRQVARDRINDKSKPGPVSDAVLGRLSGVESGSIRTMLDKDNKMYIVLDLYPAK